MTACRRTLMRRFTMLAASVLAITMAADLVRAAGILVPSRDDVPPLKIVDHLVSARIRNQIAITTLNQTFKNESGRRLEATYIFPIPEGADITDFRMTFNGKMVEGEVLPADEAREIYESIVRRRRDPGLIEFIGRRLMRARVFPIEPHSTTEIQIEYQQVIDRVSNMSRYRYPLRTPGTEGHAYGTVRFSVDLESPAPLRAVWSPSHSVEVIRDGEHKAKVAFEKSGASLDEDFVLLYDTGEQDVGLSLVSYKPKEDDNGHFLLILSPKALWEEIESVPQDYVFVVDTSGSMAGEKIEQAQEALKYCVNRLEADDRFSVVRFSTGFDLVFDELKEATGEAKHRAVSAISDFDASGGTNIHDALEQAVRMRADDSDRPFVIVFLTDGQGDRSREEVEKMLAERAESIDRGLRIFPFGVGHNVNTKLLDSLATNHGGMPTYVQPGENLEHSLGDFFAVFSEPVLTNVKLTLPDAGISDQFPPEPGDLYHGRQLIIAGEFDKQTTGRIVLTGKRGDKTVRYEFEDVSLEPTEDAEYVPRIWAGRKIAYLMDRIRLHGESEEMIDEVVRLATRYGIQTPYTSWLVAPESERRLARRRRGERPTVFPGERMGFEGGARSGGAPMRRSIEMAEEMRGGKGGGEFDAAFEDAPDAVDPGAESGEGAVRFAESLARMRKGEAVSDAEADARFQVKRHIKGRDYWNLRGVLVDTEFGEETETIDIRFGSDAYFDLVMNRADLRPVFAAAKHVIVMAGDELAVVVRADAGLEELTDETRERLW